MLPRYCEFVSVFWCAPTCSLIGSCFSCCFCTLQNQPVCCVLAVQTCRTRVTAGQSMLTSASAGQNKRQVIPQQWQTQQQQIQPQIQPQQQQQQQQSFTNKSVLREHAGSSGVNEDVDEVVSVQDACVAPDLEPVGYLTRSSVLRSTLPDPSGRSRAQGDLLLRAKDVARDVELLGVEHNGTSVVPGAGIPLGDGMWVAERIEDECYSYKEKQPEYKVKWANHVVRTWEPARNLITGRGKAGRQLYEEWKNRAVPSKVFDDDESYLLLEPVSSEPYSGPLPSVMPKSTVTLNSVVDGVGVSIYRSRRPPLGQQGGVQVPVAVTNSAAPRRRVRGEDVPGDKYWHSTRGAIFSVCACGYPHAPKELPGVQPVSFMVIFMRTLVQISTHIF